jgi:hypothetical protein
MKRRDFFKVTGQAGSAGVALNLFPSVSAALEQMSVSSPAQLSKGWFEQFISRTFWVKVRGLHGLDLELVEIQEGPAAKGLEQFSAVFRAVGTGKPLKIGTYKVMDPNGDYLRLHLEPLSRDDGAYYRATFSLLL